MKVLWIKDSKAGHLSKALGLLMAMGGRLDLEVIEYVLDWRWPVLRQPLSWLGNAGLALDARWFLKGMPALDGIELVVSAGGATQWLNAAVSRRCGVGNVFLGSPRNLDPRGFSLIASHDAPEDGGRFFRFDLIPSAVTRKLASAAAVDAGFEVRKDIGLLIGGDGEGIHWRAEDYLSMGRKLISLAQESGAGAWLATSRRTPAAAEAGLQAMLDKAGLAGGACWAHRKSAAAPPLLAMMGACGHLFVTADSMSMTHEAVAAGAKVHSLLPDASVNPRLMGNIRFLEEKGWVLPLAADGPWRIDQAPGAGWSEVPEDPCRSLADAVLRALNPD